MRVMFATWEGATHLFPAVPLGWSFYAAGHDVRVACHPGLVDRVVEAGLPAAAVGKDYDVAGRIKQDPTQLKFTQNAPLETVVAEMRRSFALLSGFNDAVVGDMVAFARRWRPDLVIWDPIMFGGVVAARAVGAADARLLWGPDLFTHRRQTVHPKISQLAAMGGNPVLDWLGGVYQQFGLEFDENDLIGRWTIDPCPPSMRLPVQCDRVPMRYVPYNGPAVAPDWLLDPPARPRICLTPGTSSIRLTGADTLPMEAALHALGGLDAEVVVGLTAAHRGKLTNIPANVRLVEAMSFHLLLPTCSAVVHHGGAGTTMTAAVHGVPQLVIPDVADQTTNAKQLAGTGAGISLLADEADPDAIRDSVTRLLGDESFAAAATALQEEIRQQPSPPEVVRTLEELVSAQPERSGW
ncbi:MAG TPA: activator-dependent family glycosyltransferase [Micromonosporaceae bacterium]|nr:activator-dependent family glycosyltransferase [Micromonosporaceae bacterium]